MTSSVIESGIKSKVYFQSETPQLRTLEDMERDLMQGNRRLPGLGSGELPEQEEEREQGHESRRQRGLASSDRSSSSGTAQQKRIPFRPTMPLDDYEMLKSQSSAETSMDRLMIPARKDDKTILPNEGLTVPTLITRFEGADQATSGGLYPPDPHGAVGEYEFVQITNSHLDIYRKSDRVRLKSIPLDAFFGYFEQILFDPRVIYDSLWKRWIMIAEAFPESSTVQRQFIAVSTDADAIGAFYVYSVNVNYEGTEEFFWDYPQLGMDQDAIIITANVFPAFTASVFSVAKARLYNGLDFSVPVFTDLVPTLAPPIVLDQNPKTFLIAAPADGNALKLYALENSSRPDGTRVSEAGDVPVANYTVPPGARQPGTEAVLDTLDCRFVNASTQNGASLWQVHTVAIGTLPTPRFYEINTETASVIQSGIFFASLTSHDFNASIVANANNDVFVTYSSTDADAGIYAQVRCSARLSSDPEGVVGSGLVAIQSNAASEEGRWGDYSAITIDPENLSQAWFVNEKVNEADDWGTGIGAVRL